ncbi:ABC transporter substrate-binding protein [Geofilum sp. OHC36d9]|uniref:ABC transporter substrate-binding protein n=1 Tax=Geofilum sp. OHC36d9 TaxID=3458413 RepID=UPI0040341E56
MTAIHPIAMKLRQRTSLTGFIKSIGIIFFMLLLSCKTGSPSPSTQNITIDDLLGRTVSVPQNIKRIVGLNPGALRLLVYMNAVSLVSGVEDVEQRYGRPYAMAYPQLAEKPVIGPMKGGDAELLTVNHPDVIFITYATAGQADALQQKTGIPVIVLNPGNLSTQRPLFDQSLRLIGQVLDRTTRANSLIRFIDRQTKRLKKLGATAPCQPAVYLGGASYSGARGITSTVPQFEAFSFLNAHNVANGIALPPASGSIRGYTIDAEQLINWNPDHLFIDAAGLALVAPQIAPGTPLHDTLDAIQNNNVHTLMPYNWYGTNYESVLANGWFVASVLYPGMNIDFEAESRAVYKQFLGVDIFDKMTATYQGWLKHAFHD